MLNAVADIGNSRIKVCRCDGKGLTLPVRAFHTGEFDRLFEADFTGAETWGAASTVPNALAEFRSWVEARGGRVIAIDSHEQIEIAAYVDEPAKVGKDRLLNALAAHTHVKSGTPAIIIDAGSAVTVDLLNENGAFAGGTIFPGLGLMAGALRERTAQLPLIDVSGESPPGPPGKNTADAIHLGILFAVAGGIDSIVRELASRCASAPKLLLTGGDMTPRLAGLLQTRHQFQSELRPTLTLEGIFLAASRLA